MSLFAEIVSWICLVAGSLFCVVGGIGLLRLPDFYTRMHASGITDTLGAGLILVGLMFHAGLNLVMVKLLLILFFLWITSPTSTHALASAALGHGVAPRLDKEGDSSSPS